MTKTIFKNIKNNRIEEDNEITNNSDNNLNNLQQLKRPDLKGVFICVICRKQFCHSSSLSRHKMQAHVKRSRCRICGEKIQRIGILYRTPCRDIEKYGY
uniref:C2H2-type domain-containing protein n=1 Tax=Meloidogyne incognita TaxID=6306 RepID=A0A914N6U7_MELIC